MRKIPPPPKKKQTCKKTVSRSKIDCESSLIKVYDLVNRKDSKEPYDKPTQLAQPTVSKSRSPNRGQSHSGSYGKCLAFAVKTS